MTKELTSVLCLKDDRKKIAHTQDCIGCGYCVDVCNEQLLPTRLAKAVVEGNKEIVDYSSLDVFDHVKMYVEDGMSEKDAIKLVAKERDVPKSEVYSYYHNRK